ncbi:MAG TPA: TetR/AcrR family transcriptional regulator [Oligoflexus sp.]|uniref:TetR/AcrR family transcriptional regulator n=1 Tax=Oligoflexus sp. TaxID=1971216 RepID=UPI002D6D2672|nr:TetR/AcrR family transcriptional regulator [Oligoflexus sp.]HYX33548.1 TetR/AcrR family transcriptional regulator [Oligoflexus sp.]
MAGKQQRGQETSDKILKTALKLFSRHELSIERLSEESAVSIGSIYHHFSNLHGVSAALYQSSMADLLQTIIEAVRAQTTAKNKVMAQARAYIEWTRDRKNAARFIHASAYAPYMQQYEQEIRQAKEPILQELMALFEPHIRAGELIALPLPLYEILLIGPLAELARRWLSGGSGLDLEAAWEFLPERIWQSVQPKEH